MLEETIEYAKRNKKYDRRLVETVLGQDSSMVEAKATAESKKLYSLARQVKGDAHRINGYTRLNISKHGILFGEIVSEHEVEDIVVGHFVRRFPKFVIVIASNKGCFIGHKDMKQVVCVKKDMKDVVRELEDSLPVNKELIGFDKFDDKIWETFYDSLYIEERKNIGLFLKNIPKKFHDMMDVESYKFKSNRNLGEFV